MTPGVRPGMQHRARVMARVRACVDALEPVFARPLRGKDAHARDAWLALSQAPRSARSLAADAVLLEVCRGLVGDRPENAHLRTAGLRAWVEPALLEEIRALCCAQLALLGPLYEAATLRSDRYGQGQYFTPPPLAAFMQGHLQAQQQAQHQDRGAATVVDPAVGAGALLAALPTGTRIRGADTSPICVALAQAGLMTRGFTDVEVTRQDFLMPGDDVEPDAGLVDAIVCNPPYVRHHLLAQEHKRRLAARYRAALDVDPSSLSTSYLYFLLEAIRRLRPGGILVFLTPTEFLDARFGAALKRALLAHTTVEDIYLFDRGALAFSGVLTTSAVTVARKGEAPPSHGVRLHEAALVEEGVVLGSTRTRALTELEPTARWTLQFGERAQDLVALKRARPHTLERYLRIRRGIATGANGFFVLTQAVAEAWDIEPQFLVPVIAAARDLPEGELSAGHWETLRAQGRPCWLLWVRAPAGELQHTRVRRYLEEGEARGVHRRFNCRTRAPWYKPEDVDPPDVIITYMNRGRTRFVRNTAGCRVMSTFLNGYARDLTLDMDALLRHLNTPETRRLVAMLGRTYGGGLGKIEPRELLALPVPNVGVALRSSVSVSGGILRAAARGARVLEQGEEV